MTESKASRAGVCPRQKDAPRVDTSTLPHHHTVLLRGAEAFNLPVTLKGHQGAALTEPTGLHSTMHCYQGDFAPHSKPCGSGWRHFRCHNWGRRGC